MNATVSIITPAFNAAKHIEETIQSVLNQTYPHWKMYIVDDCSQDDTVAIVTAYAQKDSRIRLLRHRKNQGVAAARNTALAVADGKYLAFLDSDDLWLPQKLEKQVAFMEQTGYVLTYTKYQKFSETAEPGKEIAVPDLLTYEDIFSNTAIACLTVMINRELSGPVKMPPMNHAEDQCTWQAVISRDRCAYALQESLALYRVSATSMTANKFKAAKKQWNVYRRHCKLSFWKSLKYFCQYAYNAVRKNL